MLNSKDPNLDVLRLKTFMNKVGKQLVKPSNLPPTSDSARFHYYRVFGQVQEWLGNDMPPTEWGWRLLDDKLYPVMSSQAAGPDFLIEFIHCACNPNGCKSSKCSCRKYGLPCTLSCSQCNGISCHNQQEVNEEQ